MLVSEQRRLGGRPLVSVAMSAVEGGVDAVQLREKDLPRKELLELGSELKKNLGSAAALLINERVDVAAAIPGTGAHLPASGPGIEESREKFGPERLLGKSAHLLEEAVSAEREGADYVIFGPVYDTESKRPYGPPRGTARLKEAASAADIPVYAIGGINPDRAAELRDAGAAGMVVMSFILDHPDPAEAARLLMNAWRRG
jgi:thiamine-phosphate pyrophosphorylase